jgi:hypothetical protein
MFKFRAEVKNDAIKFINSIPDAKNVKYKRAFGKEYPDIEVTFSTDLTHYTLIQISRGIIDNHVVRQTLSLKKNYTGVRNYDML